MLAEKPGNNVTAANDCPKFFPSGNISFKYIAERTTFSPICIQFYKRINRLTRKADIAPFAQHTSLPINNLVMIVLHLISRKHQLIKTIDLNNIRSFTVSLRSFEQLYYSLINLAAFPYCP